MESTRIACLLMVLVFVACAPDRAISAEDAAPRSSLDEAGDDPERVEGSALRPMDPQLRRVVQAGREQSPSFRAIVDRLAATDVVVYVQCARRRSHLEGELQYMGTVGGIRYVLVRLSWQLTTSRKIAILGHELQHALEIAERSAIVDSTTLARAYEQFGVARRAGSRVDFDTAAAIGTGRTIWREVTLRADGD